MSALLLKPILEPAAPAGAGAARLGGGRLGFRMVEIIERASSKRCLVSAAEAAQAAPKIYRNLVRARPVVAGLDLGQTHLMGILNVTPDSFSDGAKWIEPETAAAHGRAMSRAGASLLDIGGESTRPGSTGTSCEEQLERILPVIRSLAHEATPVSVDTRDATVMRQSIQAGAALINDVSGLRHDPVAPDTVAELAVPVILMHMRGTPEDMSSRADYDDVILDVYDELLALTEAAHAAGIEQDSIIVDPGIGFAKHPKHSIAVLRDLPLLHGLGYPLLVGASRKGFIGTLAAGKPAAEDRLAGSLMAMTWALNGGAQLLRVHDVAESRQALDLWQALV
jgi:dihydropteroate synthase